MSIAEALVCLVLAVFRTTREAVRQTILQADPYNLVRIPKLALI
jgi:hypothetical protein